MIWLHFLVAILLCLLSTHLQGKELYVEYDCTVSLRTWLIVLFISNLLFLMTYSVVSHPHGLIWEVLTGLPRRSKWHPTPVLLPGKSHGWRSLVGCSPWGRWELDTTQWLHFHFSLSCFGEGIGNPLQCSCLENPRDGGAWWAAVYGVAQSWTRLKRLSSSSSSSNRLTWVVIWEFNCCHGLLTLYGALIPR